MGSHSLRKEKGQSVSESRAETISFAIQIITTAYETYCRFFFLVLAFASLLWVSSLRSRVFWAGRERERTLLRPNPSGHLLYERRGGKERLRDGHSMPMRRKRLNAFV